MEAFETLEGDARHVAGLGEAQIDRYPRAAVLSRPGGPPAHQIAADAAEIEGERAGTPDIGGQAAFRDCHMNSVAFIVIGPESAGTAAGGAVADRGIEDFTMNGPVGRFAQAMTMGDLLQRIAFLLYIHPRLRCDFTKLPTL